MSLFADRAAEYGGVVEIALMGSEQGIVRGYFDSVEAAAAELARTTGPQATRDIYEDGTFITINPLTPAFVSRFTSPIGSLRRL